MDRWEAVRRVALARRREIAEPGKPPPTGRDLIDAAFRRHGIDVEEFDRDGIFGPGVVGCIVPRFPMCYVARWLPEGDRITVLAHEFGHFVLHADDRVQTKFQVRGGGGAQGSDGGYSPQELKELQADVFAREFLCPSDWLRGELAQGRTPEGIARTIAVPLDVVLDQSVAALLAKPELAMPAPRPVPPSLTGPLAEAASWRGGHLLLEGGPGRGKTTALIARLMQLTAEDTPPSAIAVVTASDQGAAHLRRRLPVTLACELRVGTVRTLALDLARRWPVPSNRLFNPVVMDRVDALATLEDVFAAHGIDGSRGTLVTTLRELGGIEPRQSPERRASSLPDDAFARVSQAFEANLTELNAFDPVGAVRVATRLIRTVPEVEAECRSRFVEILVDDAEDLPSTDVDFLTALCGLGARLWATGCADVAVRRSGRSALDFPGNLAARVALKTIRVSRNHRANGIALAACETSERSVPSVAGRRTMPRATTGATARDEARLIAANVEGARRAGIAHGDQVILARSHLTLRRLSPHLRDMGIPLADFGDLAGRPEVRMLTAVLDRAADAEAFAPTLRRGLFEELGILPPMLARSDDLDTQVALLVIHHVLCIAAEHDASFTRNRLRFEERIAHAGALDQDTAFRKETLDASSLDAVRIMTIHAAKGLEFGAVHLAGLSQGYMPLPRGRRQGASKHEGPRLVDPSRNEEDALLLVALSRARDAVFLTRAESYAGPHRSPSPYLSLFRQ